MWCSRSRPPGRGSARLLRSSGSACRLPRWTKSKPWTATAARVPTQMSITESRSPHPAELEETKTVQVYNQRRLGRTSINVTAMTFGAAPIGNFMRPFSDADAAVMVNQAWDLGIRSFDTAPSYGHGLSEHRLGHALRERPRTEYAVSYTHLRAHETDS